MLVREGGVLVEIVSLFSFEYSLYFCGPCPCQIQYANDAILCEVCCRKRSETEDYSRSIGRIPVENC